MSQLKQKMKSSSSPINESSNQTPIASGPSGGPSNKKLYHSLKFFYQKIDIYVNSFEDEDRLENLMANIQKNH